MMDINEIFQTIDRLFDENRAKEAESYMLECLDQAKKQQDSGLCLQIFNELIGYYRQTSEVDKLQAVIEESLKLAWQMGLSGTVPYATTALNAANAYRSIGDYDNSMKYYGIAEEIYQQNLKENDMLFAGLYNNMSLLYQEFKDYAHAEEFLLRALEIVKAQNAGFEIAVTYANLANTCVLAQNYDRAAEYAKTSIACFKERNFFDAHYCAALSALGMCCYHKGEYKQAMKLFEEGMEIVENSLGRNRQYERLMANRDACRQALDTEAGESVPKQPEQPNIQADTEMTGLELCRKYYETYGAPMIQELFPEYASRIAVGLVGEGSDCFGYDDGVSRDHDWGPDFCLWVTDETYQEIGDRLTQEYEKLPVEFMGFRRTKSRQGQNRRGVMRISDFYRRLLGTDSYEHIDWSSVEDYALAAAVNGEVYRDDEGIFSAFREQLKKGYPEEIRLLKLAEDAAKLSQTGQYNYFRMLERGDMLTADLMMSQCIAHGMRLQHHFLNQYPPHDKWLYRSTMKLERGAELCDILSALRGCLNQQGAMERARTLTQTLGAFFARELYDNSDISDIDPYLDMQTEELVEKASYAVMTKEELVDRIARVEFEAFDKVKNEGGRAYCQNDWPTFSIMRKSQYLTWSKPMLMQYLYDFNRENRMGHNLITEKYGRMMESTAPERYEEIKDHFPELTEEKKAVIEQIVGVQMRMMEDFALRYPHVAGNARRLHTYEDNPEDTSYETYLRGEISTYSDKMLQLYGRYVVECYTAGVNIAEKTIENTAKLYGYESIGAFEKSALVNPFTL